MSDRDKMIEALVALLHRPHGNLTGGERQDVATALTALQAENCILRTEKHADAEAIGVLRDERHADLPPTPAQIMADPRVQALVNALERIAHASDVYGVEANAEDQGAETLAYAHKSTCNLARAALAAIKEPKP